MGFGSARTSAIMTLVNSTVGVSILSMPFCFKQCGVLLASFALIFGGLLTRLSCHYLLKSMMISRRRNFEFLAFHVYGGFGKTLIEMSIICLMIGTSITFFVVVGDLAPAIVRTLLEYENAVALRTSLLLGVAIFIVLPLGMLRRPDSLSTICTASFLFYVFLVFKLFTESFDEFFSGVWIENVHLWRPIGLLQCLPIFAMALSCQTQIFDVLDHVPAHSSLETMNSVIKSTVNLTTGLYIGVGFFGYITYRDSALTGNVLLSFPESLSSEFIKLGFVVTIAISFPMVILPCRTSIHSLLFGKGRPNHYELVSGKSNYIPETRFKCITILIISVSVAVALVAPNVEVVLGLLGSTIGVVICLLFPPVVFSWVAEKRTVEHTMAQIMFAFGLCLMVVGTYSNIFPSNEYPDVEIKSLKLVESGKFEEVSKQNAALSRINENDNLVKPELFSRNKKNVRIEGGKQLFAEIPNEADLKPFAEGSDQKHEIALGSPLIDFKAKLPSVAKVLPHKTVKLTQIDKPVNKEKPSEKLKPASVDDLTLKNITAFLNKKVADEKSQIKEKIVGEEIRTNNPRNVKSRNKKRNDAKILEEDREKLPAPSIVINANETRSNVDFTGKSSQINTTNLEKSDADTKINVRLKSDASKGEIGPISV